MPSDFETDVAVDFSRITSRQLKPIAVVAQCLDNQWVPRGLLRRMLDNGLSFDDADIEKRRRTGARAEYLRAILNSEQVIINRAYLFNNPVVYQDFMRADQQRETFRSLLAEQVVIPFLLAEESPGQPPHFTKDVIGWPAWRHLIQETQLHCLRLSWDPAENELLAQRHLYKRFRKFIGSLPFLDEGALRTDLALDEDRMEQLTPVLLKAMHWAAGEANATRDGFYKAFVVADDTDTARGCYDRHKPFAGELKQLADLRYNTNLPDILDRFPLIPTDSLHRTALQEERLVRLDQEPIDPAELAATLLRRRVFDLVQVPLQVSLTGLKLSHVWRARQTPEWHAYITELQGLVNEPMEFDQRAQRVYDSYVRLAERLAEIVGVRRADATPPWLPVIKVAVEVLGATIMIVYSADPVVEVEGLIAQEVAIRASTAVIRFIVGSHDRRKARNELGTGIEMMRVRFAPTGAAFDELLARLEASGLPVRRVDAEDGADHPGMDGAGAVDDET